MTHSFLSVPCICRSAGSRRHEPTVRTESYRGVSRHVHSEGRLWLSVFTCSHVHRPGSYISVQDGARCSSVVRAFAHGAMGRRIDPSWGGPIELFLVPASVPRLV